MAAGVSSHGQQVMPWISRWHSIAALLAVVACLRPPHQKAEATGESFGRLHSLHPVSHCCTGEACIADGASERRHAVVTALRSPGYLMGLRELSCTLERTNPGVKLIILGAAGDFDPDGPIVQEIRQLGEYR